jgi:aminopeptidase-like protein
MLSKVPDIASAAADVAPVPVDMMDLLKRLYPITRSLTGDGVRQTLDIIARHIPISIREVATGTKVFDWEIPNEWNIKAATISSMGGEVLIDFNDCNLHVMGYSVPVDEVISRQDLSRHVHTLPDQPDVIPYRTSYYSQNWGFCLKHSVWESMRDEHYAVRIDSELAPGALTYGELFIAGATDGEILISVHVCHPSLANDNLSGIVVAVALAQQLLARRKSRLGVRFLFIPATIGSIAWLALNEDRLDRIRNGLVLTCVGDPGPFHYKRSRSGAVVDTAVAHALSHSPYSHRIVDFDPYGYDERQYGSPGIGLPVGCLMRAVHGTFPQYHTSADNCEFVSADALGETLSLVDQVLEILDRDRVVKRVDGRGEPQLGRRGLYRAIAGQKEAGGASQMDLLWVLNQADGKHSLLDIAERAGVPFSRIDAAASLCLEAFLLMEVGV